MLFYLLIGLLDLGLVLDFLKDQTVSIIILLVFGIIQLIFFCSTNKKLSACVRLFPKKDLYRKEEINDSVLIGQIDPKGEFEEIRVQTNMYLKNNPSSLEIDELKGIANRYSDTKYEEATSQVSLPMYLGLMGTYAGVAYGLVMLFFGQNTDATTGEFVTNDALFQFIGGVVVAMVTSLFGLILTTLNSRTAAKKGEAMDKRKEGYFLFLQTKIYPSSPSTIANTLNNSVNRLRTTVDSLTENLTRAFSGITSEFGENLKKNLEKIDQTVLTLKESTETMKASMDKHEEITKKLLSPEYLAALQKIDETLSLCGDNAVKAENTNRSLGQTLELQERSAEQMASLSEIQTGFIDTQRIINEETQRSQQSFLTNLAGVNDMFARIEAILRRFSTFEESVNKFAEAEIGRNTGALEQIDEQIRQIKKVRESIKEYLEENEAGLTQHLAANRDAIQRAADKFRDEWGRIFYQMDPEHLVRPEQFYQKIEQLETTMNEMLRVLPELTSHQDIISGIEESTAKLTSGQRLQQQVLSTLLAASQKSPKPANGNSESDGKNGSGGSKRNSRSGLFNRIFRKRKTKE